MAAAAREASRGLASLPGARRDAALRRVAGSLRAAAATILVANAADLESFSGTPGMRDRLALTPARIEAMASGVEQVAALPDPLDRTLASWVRPNGLRMRRVASPIGVIGMIYESRPNVGVDAAALCLKSGNAVILRGGSDSFSSGRAIHAALRDGLLQAGVPEAAVQQAPSPDRAFVSAMLAASGRIDLIIPRGGRGLVERVQRDARVPVLSHAEGLCHTFVHAAADEEMAVRILADAKMRRTSICGATETLLVDAEVVATLLPPIVARLRALGCDFRADERARQVMPELCAAGPDDFATEWLDATLSVAVVDGVDGALEHIARHGSEHTEAIVTNDPAAARQFLDGSNSAVTMWNASTQFCDGGEFGFGAEIGIATGRLHARGPIGVEQLTTFRYVVEGSGQVRG